LSEEETHESEGNPMLTPRIEKVTATMSVGRSGDPLERASKVLEQLTEQRTCRRKAKKTIRDFGIRKGEPIACLVTLRREKAREFLKKAFQGVDNKIRADSFDVHGNFSFGIEEHVTMPGTTYSQELGIFSLGVSVTLGKPGFRVKRRRHAKSKIGRRHLLTREESVSYIKNEFGIDVV
jgi:large subunit ribosomal protein L5